MVGRSSGSTPPPPPAISIILVRYIAPQMITLGRQTAFEEHIFRSMRHRYMG